VNPHGDTWPWTDPEIMRRIAMHRGQSSEPVRVAAPPPVVTTQDRAADDLPGWIGPYRPLRRIRSGPLAETFIARRDGAARDELTSVKRIHPNLQHLVDARALFAHEGRLLGLLHHPSVIRGVDLAPAAEHGYFATEFVRGHALPSLVRRSEQLGFRMPLRHVIGIVASIAEALEHAHGVTDDTGAPLHVVHGDVSPANIMIADDGTVKLTDFGAAQSRLRAPQSRVRPNLGPVAYMSPEQSRGEATDRRSDVYALGVVLWELSTWSRLYRRLAPEQVIARVAIGAVPLPSQVRADIPAELEDVTMIALQPAAHRRFSCAGEFARNLRRLAGKPDPRGLDAWIRRMFHP
jgi:serine/threonine-protein kinase